LSDRLLAAGHAVRALDSLDPQVDDGLPLEQEPTSESIDARDVARFCELAIMTGGAPGRRSTSARACRLR
jgi:nucleoside-diphosphate-sugar epimerase